MIDKSAIDPNALHYFRTLKSAGFAAYFVGGSVRDLLLGKTPKDFDIATNATPHQIKRIIPQGKIIGKRFRHVILEKDGGRYEIVTFRGPVVESLQEDEESASAKRYPDLNQFGNAEQDASRRDFTINALFYDPDADELIDYVGGKNDIDSRLVRTIGDPFARLKEDPIRILRAIRHKVKLGLRYSPDLQEAIHACAPELQTTSKDRIREEFLKICSDRTLGAFLQEAREVKVSEYITPWFKEVSEDAWSESTKLWEMFTKVDQEQELPAETGLAMMIAPLVNEVIVRSFEERIPVERRTAGMLPDIKFFLGSEKLRNWLLRILRISKVQTDTVLRASFYYSRMTGKWLEEGGAPKRIEAKLRSQEGALIGAFIAKVWLLMQGKEVPEWIQSYASMLWQKSESKKFRNDNRSRRTNEKPAPHMQRSNPTFVRDREAEPLEQDRDRDEMPRRNPAILPILDKPLIWNGPLHPPALRPIFHEDASTTWLKDGTTQAYRPSGIPILPVDKAILSSMVTQNYKPEFALSESPTPPPIERTPSRPYSNRNFHSRPVRAEREESHVEEGGSSATNESNNDADENTEDFAPEDFQSETGQERHSPPPYDEDPDDNIGNRIDGPPTSGYAEFTGDNFSPDDPGMLTSHTKSISHRTRRPPKNQQKRHRGGRHRRGGRSGGGHGNRQGGKPQNFREPT